MQAVFNSVQIRQWNSNTTVGVDLKTVDYTYGRNVCQIKKNLLRIISQVAVRINTLGKFSPDCQHTQSAWRLYR